jgi:multiple sugar transport system permease protein
VTRQTKRYLTKAARKTILYIVVTGLAMVIVFPMFFLVSFSFMSDYETYSEWPSPLIPKFSAHFQLRQVDDGFALSIYNHAADTYKPFGPEKFNTDPEELKKVSDFVKRQANCILSVERLEEEIAELYDGQNVNFSLRKSLLTNYIIFFQVTRNSVPAVFRSVYTAFATVGISLVVGGMAGFAFARYRFKGRNMLKLSVLFVRMFPGVAIAIPMVIILGNMGLYDKPVGLSLVYSVTQISLTIWITASIFLGIPVSLEEAALIFGSTRLGAFWRVTLPLALPGLAACAMYAFIGAWNEAAQAIILTQFNPTFPVVVYEVLIGARGRLNLLTAGSIAQALPAVIFTLFIRKYIVHMWGGVRV